MRVVLLHTSPVHVATFDALRDEEAPDVELVHRVREDLLDVARTHGPSAVAADVAAIVAEDDVVLCTCSTIGAIAEFYGALRVDRPMAAAAAASDRPVVVLAALESTLEPTLALLAEEGLAPVEAHLVPGAWDRFEAGDVEGYLALVSAAVDEHPDATVVLAQASMAPAATRPGVLSSPRLGFLAAVRPR